MSTCLFMWISILFSNKSHSEENKIQFCVMISLMLYFIQIIRKHLAMFSSYPLVKISQKLKPPLFQPFENVISFIQCQSQNHHL